MSSEQPAPRTLWGVLADELRTALSYVAGAAAAVGGTAHLVGGPVRDLLRGDTRLRDLDVTLTFENREGRGLAVDARIVADALQFITNGTVVQRTDFGTATVRLPDLLGGIIEVDLATARTEIYAVPGALPSVTFPASLADDLRRRDFTINAMALPLTPDGFGPLVAAPHAEEDLRRGLVRVLHDASFRDDPTRLFRAARYAARYRFTFEAHTTALFTDALAARSLDTISPARKRHEIELGMLEADGVGCLAAFAARGLLAAASPALVWDAWIATKLRRILPLVHLHQRERQERATRETRVITTLWPAWACFVCRQGEGVAARLFADLGPFTMPMERDIRRAVRLFQACAAIMPETRLSTIAEFVDGLPEDAVLALFADEPRADRLAAYYRRTAEIAAENRHEHHFGGDDLTPFNLPPDARRRRVLDALRDARLDGEVRTFSDEASFVERYIHAHDLGA